MKNTALSSTKKTRLCITTGEPAGIGPDILIKLLQAAQTNPSLLAQNIELVYIGDPDLLYERAQQLNTPLSLNIGDNPTNKNVAAPHSLNCYPVEGLHSVTPGTLNPQNSPYIIDTLEAAVTLCELDQNHKDHCHGIVTGPVHKGVICDSGIAFSGHTGWLEQRTKAKGSVMVLMNQHLKVALTTTHIPLRAVADSLTESLLEKTITTLHQALQQHFSIQHPKLVICGLNPHAGEDGHLGLEEIEVITPVIERLRKQGMHLIGPLPADTAFLEKQIKKADAFLTHYHDQGLPVLKYSGFESAINVTLGLPIIRTSVDHGTALDLAGHGTASFESLRVAINTAAQMAKQPT